LEIRAKQRLVGVIVLAALAIVFIPLFFKSSKPAPKQITLSAQLPAAPTPVQPNPQALLAMQSSELHEQGNTATLNMASPNAPAPNPKFATAPTTTPIQSAPTTTTTATPIPTPAPVAPPVAQSPPVITTTPPAKTTATPPTTKKTAAHEINKTKIKPKTKTTLAKKHEKSAHPINVAKLVDIDEQIKAEQKTTHPKKSKQNLVGATGGRPHNTTHPTHLAAQTGDHRSPLQANSWIIQLGTFSNTANAKKLEGKLRAKGFSANIHEIKTPHGTMVRVFVGPEIRHDWAETVRAKVENEFLINGVVVPFGTTKN
jgi:cell division septation protein DedD